MTCRLLIALLGTTVAVAACGQPAGTLKPSTDTAADAQVITFAVGDRKELPTLSGQALNGESLSTAQYADSVLIVNLWGSWCGPCRAEAPLLRDLALQYKAQGVEFLGVNTRDKSDAAQAFERNYGISYPSLVDDGGRLTVQLNGIVPVNAVPSTIAIDRQGRVAAVRIGEITGSQVLTMIRAADPSVDLGGDSRSAPPTPTKR